MRERRKSHLADALPSDLPKPERGC
jgi:hypothetical protein